MPIKNEKKLIAVTLIIIFLLRLLFSVWPNFDNKANYADFATYRKWIELIINTGFSKFYGSASAFPYPPLFNYYLYFIGIIKSFFFTGLPLNHNLFTFLLKFPNNFGDIISAYLIYKVVRLKIKFQYSYIIMLSYCLQPASFFITEIWGQTDGFLTMLLLCSFYLLSIIKKPYLAVLFFALAVLTKPQALAFFIPFFLYLFLISGIYKFIFSGLFFFFLLIIISYPFFPENPLLGIFSFYLSASRNFFPHFTSSAFNFWYLFYGGWKDKFPEILGIFAQKWIYFLTFLANIISGLVVIKKRNRRSFYLALLISGFGFFLFFAPIKERYLYSVIPLMLISAALYKSRLLFFIYAIASLLFFINVFSFYDGWIHHDLWNSTYLSAYSLDKIIAFSFLSLFAIIIYKSYKFK